MGDHRGLTALAGRRHHCVTLGTSCRTLTCTLGGKILKLEVKIEAAAATKLCFLHILVLAIVCIILHKASKLFVQDWIS